ncbi:MAG: hypothetical protein QOH62_1425 [Solirubrobacteraceae bacterium]|nr:hypothetical protein [Solirubrobacteraceae bacterium]
MPRPVQLLTVMLAFATPVAGQASTAHRPSHPANSYFGLCWGHHANPADRCVAGKGRTTPGGNGKVSHVGWPAVTGIVWFANQNGSSDTGTDFNDELLGGHGNDTISGGRGRDIIWGDQLPDGNNTWQHDTLRGGSGPDWIYSSHGYNDIAGGSGNDRIWGHFGNGTIDCGRGYDTVHVKRHPTYRLRRCEVVLHH